MREKFLILLKNTIEGGTGIAFRPVKFKLGSVYERNAV